MTPGRRIGVYEVVAPIGAGGMGEVYRARDTRLGRDVAIKVLPHAFASDPDRLVRFEREARVLASLNHPNIATIHGIEESGGVKALVLELVPGETLAERIARVGGGGLPLADAVAIARQIADALDAAHEKGIIHRDLKPANIKIAPGGLVKVLDFGLAKLQPVEGESNASQTPTAACDGTREGLIVGTAAYMSPEQAREQVVDKRTDIWAFGCVAFEMLTGCAAFARPTITDTLAAILEREPDWTALPVLPPLVVRLLQRCLEKDVRNRLRDIADARPELSDEWLAAPSPNGVTGGGRQPSIRGWRMATAAAAGTGVVVLAAVFGGRSQDSLDVSSFRFAPIAAEPNDETSPSWSPDEKSIVYTADVDGIKQVFARTLDSAASVQITKSSTDCAAPFWSPDGTRIYFISPPGGTLWSIGATGGDPQLVLEDVAAASLSPDGDSLAFLRGPGGNRSLWLTSVTKREPRRYETAPFPASFGFSNSVEFSPDGAKIGVLVRRQEGLIYTSELWVVPYPEGRPRLVLERIPEAADGRLSWAADNRHVVWNSAFPDRLGSHLFLADTARGSIRQITSGTHDELSPSVSRSGDRIAFAAGATDSDLLRVPLDGSSVQPLLASSRSESRPTWSPAGNQYAYVTNARGTWEMWARSVDEGWTRPIVRRDADGPAGQSLSRPSFSPDGLRIVYEVWNATHAIWVASTADGRGVPLDRDSPDQHSPAWSPDGRWVAYQRLSGDKWDLVKVPSGGGAPIRVGDATPGGGDHTAWSPTGEWIAHVLRGRLVLTAADGHSERSIRGAAPTAFGYSRDGSLLYVIRRSESRRWGLVTIDMRTLAERSTVELNISPAATLSGFSLHPDGRSFATGIGMARRDIWVLDGFKLPSRRFGLTIPGDGGSRPTAVPSR